MVFPFTAADIIDEDHLDALCHSLSPWEVGLILPSHRQRDHSSAYGDIHGNCLQRLFQPFFTIGAICPPGAGNLQP